MPLDEVDLFYDTNEGIGGTPYPNFIATRTASDLSYQWTVPDAIGDKLRVNIRDHNGTTNTIEDTSDTNFEVRGKLELLEPPYAGAEGNVLLITSTKTISWQKWGNITSVKLEYATDGGTVYHSLNWDGEVEGSEVVVSTSGTAPYPKTYTYDWTIPDNASTTVKVKVTNYVDSNVSDETGDSPYLIIRGGFEWVNPDPAAAEVAWPVDSYQTLEWNTFGTINWIVIEYSTTLGAAGEWKPVTGGAIAKPATDQYSWQIPDDIANPVYLRIYQDGDEATEAVVTNVKIHGTLELTRPDGTEHWRVNTTEAINWDMHGSINLVKLEYSKVGGGSDVNYLPPNGDVIYASTPGGPQTADWNIPPEAISANAMIRITDISDPTVQDESVSFKIKASFTVTNPDSADTLVVDAPETIVWQTNGSVSEVNLYYWRESISDWVLINETGPVTNNGSYPWTVADNISNNVQIRVADANDPDAYGDSEVFKITGELTLTSPWDGDKLKVGSIEPIMWDRHGSIDEVYLDYHDGVVWHSILTATDDPEIPNEGSFAWEVPDNLTDQARLRITGVGFPSITHTTSGFFKIMGGFTVNYPNGGEALLVGSTPNITWISTSSSTNIPNVSIDYSVESGAEGTFTNSITVSTPNDGSHPWPITTDVPVCGTVRVRVSDATDPDAYDDSNTDFNIRASFTLLEPNGDPDPDQTDHWVIGREHTIQWVCVGTLADVKLEYSLTGNFLTSKHTIGVVPNIAAFDWTIPAQTGSGASLISDNVKIRVSDPDDPEAYDDSDNDFRITTGFIMISPNGGTPPTYEDSEVLKVGGSFNITWSCTSPQSDVPQVVLKYSTDGGASFPNIITATDNDGFYTWNNIDDNISDEVKVRVSDMSDDTAFDASDANFNISADFTLLGPNGGGGQELTVGEFYDVTWSCEGSVTSVQLDYSKDDFTTPIPIIASTSNDGSHPWKVPNDPNATSKVRVMSTLDSKAFDESDDYFSIVVGVLVLDAPVGGERWVTREDHLIEWRTVSGSIPLVNIDYSKDDFVSDVHSVVADYANTTPSNSYLWNIPDDRSTTVRVRVSDVRDETVNSISNEFTIDYYTVEFSVIDLLTGEDLALLSLEATSNKGDDWIGDKMPGNPDAPLGSPVTFEWPYGSWSALWSKLEYGDKQVSFMLDRDLLLTDPAWGWNPDPLVEDGAGVIHLETLAIHIWRAYSDFAYDPVTDTLSVTSWLERDGFVVTGGKQADVYIYDPTTGAELHHLTDTTRDSAGFFYTQWSGTGLEAGKVYSTITDITNISDAHFKTPDSFSITEETKLQDVQNTVTTVLDKPISDVETGIQNKLDLQTIIIQQEMADQALLIDQRMDEQEDIIIQKTDEMADAIDDSLTSFETKTTTAITKLESGAEKAVEAGEELEATAKKYSWKAVVAPDPAITGDEITLSLQGQSGKFPLLDIYSWDNKPIISRWIMTEVSSGRYVFEFTADNRFMAGKAYTYIITESDTGGIVTGSGMVEEMSITTLAGLTAAAPEAARTAKKILEAMKSVEAALGAEDGVSIALTLKNLHESIEELPELINQEGASAVVTSAINDISDKLDEIASQEGFDISNMLEEKLSESPTIKAIRSKTDAIEAVVALLRALFEAKFGGMDTPIVSTTLTY